MSKELYEPALRYLAGNYDGSASEGEVRVIIPNRIIGETILTEVLKRISLPDEKSRKDILALISAINDQREVLPRKISPLLNLKYDLNSLQGNATTYLRGVKDGHLNTSEGQIEIMDFLFVPEKGDTQTLESLLDELANDQTLNSDIFTSVYRERLKEFADAIGNSESIEKEDLRDWLAKVRGPIKQVLKIYL